MFQLQYAPYMLWRNAVAVRIGHSKNSIYSLFSLATAKQLESMIWGAIIFAFVLQPFNEDNISGFFCTIFRSSVQSHKIIRD